MSSIIILLIAFLFATLLNSAYCDRNRRKIIETCVFFHVISMGIDFKIDDILHNFMFAHGSLFRFCQFCLFKGPPITRCTLIRIAKFIFKRKNLLQVHFKLNQRRFLMAIGAFVIFLSIR